MASKRKSVTVAPKGMGLNDFVAQQEGFFAAEGLDVTLDWKVFRGRRCTKRCAGASLGRTTGSVIRH